MCGIVGAVAQNNVIPILIEGLKRLEYRGYDSCGVAVHLDGKLQRSRSTSRVADLESQIVTSGLNGFTGIAHTRWATHGAPATHNAHPHFSRDRIALVHNGIIENHDDLRAELQAVGYVFESQTDTEVIAHLVDHMYTGDLFDTVQQAVKRLTGAYAIAVFSLNEPHRVVAARQGSPLIVGIGKGQNFVASDAMAIAGTTDQIVYLEEGDVVDLQLQGVWIVDANGKSVEREVKTVHAYSSAVELGPYQHYMQKEIFEQPRAIADTLEGVINIMPELFGDKAFSTFQKIDSVLILACGTSYYAGLTAKYWLESIAKIPTNVEIASEYRYRDSVPNPNTLVVTITQSGETADTLAAVKHARALGMLHTLTICNAATSAMVRECALAYITRAGVEVGVASTKAFTTQLVGLFLLTLALAQSKNRLSDEQEQAHLKALRHLPAALQSVLALEPHIVAWAEAFARKENALFLGRGIHYPIALEGALKLKEITYIHAEAYAAGELKHGPLALVTEEMPVVTVAPNDALIEKLKSNMQEVRARGGQLYVFADADSRINSSEGVHVIRLPENYGVLSPILHVVPLQLLAYHTALARGTDVDKPRNLAKSVTVE
ncbi:glutamine--fructose-6-phosphate transaminase (isomerizing) [Glaciimonas sp. CA11.2]|uniref:glutamine--fructose-6-phosphate transaminase (isomerizing) n=1 Tax=unclassified Glaciimonas TaxID=2644401 RepID=UPI002AB4344B|nr:MULTISPECIES: glutamine--fructose-6-phosphate transaminase (isomerizing) [unclassified Glaciimonas]MDY7545826.1 glutamine--fructose-6-phosphate transaminase (isomerizing) [Glaciimonas sp. CA11.2]MEB0011528.1 glutamine--fructose-6-phosphate transaminase (isomerizing) [Glaciimonas sp. Cout2]MEB0081325.1 glutamine--fructose-6-phosphate transaminase (isomerizing) [Glaciimonas sp. Gout2]MEB0162240.1 glutamine--fructose-6-phosphate transaminase (isomerizing) [Glaciimonas sp. CA11.2]